MDMPDTVHSAPLSAARAGTADPGASPTIRALKSYIDVELARRFGRIDVKGYVEGADLEAMPVARFFRLYFLAALVPANSDRALCLRVSSEPVLRWFMDMDPSESDIDHSVYCRLRRRLRWHPAIGEFYATVVVPARLRYTRGYPGSRCSVRDWIQRDCMAA